MGRWTKQQIVLIVVLALVIVGLGAYTAYQSGRLSAGKQPAGTPTPSVTVSPTAGATPSPAVAAASPTPQTGPQRCHTSGLSAAVSASNGAAGTTYQTLKLTNTSGAACTLHGFPGVSLTDGAGAQLGAAAVRNGAAGAIVTLAAGGAAYAAVGFPNAGNFEPGACSAKSVNLRVYPPDETDPLTVADVQQACPGFSVASVTLTSPN